VKEWSKKASPNRIYERLRLTSMYAGYKIALVS
jgi:hypothetical protein